MKFNTKIRYGLRVMIELAMNTSEQGLLQKEIAQNQSISLKYLDHIIPLLKIGGLIRNVKGKKSGYILTRDASEITPEEIFRAFDPSIVEIDCLDDHEACDRNSVCAARSFWIDLQSTLEKFLSSMTLQELAEREEKKKMKKENEVMYHI